MAQMVGCWPVTTEGQVTLFGICGGQIDIGTGFSQSSSPVNIIPSWFSILMYHLGDEQ
jgi:hypothetical protein